jgi:H+-translocating NAD(P) transhydrogenase subunit alpha
VKVVVLKETRPGERRVALVPESVRQLAEVVDVVIEAGAGVDAGFADAAYADVGGRVELDRTAALADAAVLLCVAPPAGSDGVADPGVPPPGSTLIGMLQPAGHRDYLANLAERGVHALALELVPRITRAQRMDVLSSQATVGGYKAVLLAASASSRFFPMLMTAAGTIPPAKVLVLGAGVAGLQAIATARRLGAVVQGFDIRPVVREQVESLGATWVGMEAEDVETAGGYAKEVSADFQKREHEHLHRLVAEADVVITTAQIPGRPAPRLVTEDMVAAMRHGSVIVDLAAESGGNCALTRAGEETDYHGVRVLGPVNLPASMPFHASQMYSRNIAALLNHLVDDGELRLDLEDEITRACMVAYDGRVLAGA